MSRWSLRLTALLAAVSLLAGLVVIVKTASPALANPVDVSAEVPVGIIKIQGKTSPGAQVNIYIDGSNNPAISLGADGAGNFSGEISRSQAGLVDLGIQAVDTSGIKSPVITKQVAVIAQQTSTLVIILPPTIAVSLETAVFQTGTLRFSGQSVPNSTVKVTIEPDTILTTTADSSGNYAVPLLVKSLRSAGVYSYGVEADAGGLLSDYRVAGSFVITPPTQPPIESPHDLISGLGAKVTRPSIAAPEISFPELGEYESAQPMVITGRAEPGSVVMIYDEDVVIGAVVAGSDGVWRFYFSPYKDQHQISAKACQADNCSQPSRQITIKRSASSMQPACRPGLKLDSYRLTATVGSGFSIYAQLTNGAAGVLYVSWGGDESERFDSDASGRVNLTHSYDRPGVYNGYVILDDVRGCQSAVYFAVSVSQPGWPLMTIGVVVVVIGVGVGAYWLTRKK